MNDAFKIFVDQLRDGREKKIKESFPPAFLEIDEPDLSFKKNVDVEGVAYLAEKDLIINWDVRAEALVRCSICNELVPVEIQILNEYHDEPLANIKSGIYNFKDALREMILLEVPPFTECNQGSCPKRQEIKKYLKENERDESDSEGYRPFADLDWK